jgi:membrane protein DedA with SNARE-associated domain
VTALASISETLTSAVADHGVVAAFVLMAVDALLPVGGELIMVVAGAIAAGAIAGDPRLFGHDLAAGTQTYVAYALAGTLGYVGGSLVGWLIGRHIGREVLERHGHLVHLGPANVERAERWFDRHGALAVFLGRLTPLVRSFISIPAGLFGEPLGRYLVLTLAGSAIWCFGFAGAGWALGKSYESADQATHIVEVLLALAALAAAGTWFWRRSRRRTAR